MQILTLFQAARQKNSRTGSPTRPSIPVTTTWFTRHGLEWRAFEFASPKYQWPARMALLFELGWGFQSEICVQRPEPGQGLGCLRASGGAFCALVGLGFSRRMRCRHCA
jgi:hypothetical protein